jgi:hypothetical protein
VAGLKKKKSEAEIRTEIEAAYPIYFGM